MLAFYKYSFILLRYMYITALIAGSSSGSAGCCCCCDGGDGGGDCYCRCCYCGVSGDCDYCCCCGCVGGGGGEDIATSVPRDRCIINVRFYVGIKEQFPGVDVCHVP